MKLTMTHPDAKSWSVSLVLVNPTLHCADLGVMTRPQGTWLALDLEGIVLTALLSPV